MSKIQTPGVSLITSIQRMLGHGHLGFSPRSLTVANWHRNHVAASKKVESWSDAFCVWTKKSYSGKVFVKHATGTGRTTFIVSDNEAFVVVTAGSGIESGAIVGVAHMVHDGEWKSNIWLHESAAQRPDRYQEFFVILQESEILIGEGQIKKLKELYLSARRHEEWWVGQANPYYFWSSLRRGPSPFEKAMSKFLASSEVEEWSPDWDLVNTLRGNIQVVNGGRERIPRA